MLTLETIQHLRFPFAFWTFGVLGIMGYRPHVWTDGFFQLWNSRRQCWSWCHCYWCPAWRAVCARGSAVWACGALWQKSGVAQGIAWYRFDYRSENHSSSYAKAWNEKVHFGQLQLVRRASPVPVAFLSAIRIEKKKGIAFEISHHFTGFWHLMTGDIMNRTSEVLTGPL